MSSSKRVLAGLASLFTVAACASGVMAAGSSQTYFGNGKTDFGGEVGNGSLTVSDDGTGNLTFTFNPYSGHATLDNNALVLYVSTGVTGISNTSSLTDNQDGGRTSITGNNTSNGHSTVTFASGFQAAYAFSIEDQNGGKFAGLFGLPPADPAATASNLHYVTGNGVTSEPAVFTATLANFGLTEGQSFDFVGTLISTSAYRSDESFGTTDASGNPGFGVNTTFSNYDTFYTPEPASLSALALVGVVGLRRRTRVVSSS